MRIDEILSCAAREAPESTALFFGEDSLSFAELDSRVDRLAQVLTTLAGRGDRVAVLSLNHAAVVEAYYAAPRAGMTLVLLNFRLSPAEIVQQLAASGASVLIGERSLLDRLPADPDELASIVHRIALDGTRSGELDYRALLADPGSGDAPLAGADNDPAWVIYTSGTTGRAKGVALTNRNLFTSAAAAILERPVGNDDVYLYPFPLCHVSGYNILGIHMRKRPVVLLRRFDPDVLLEAIARHHVSMLSIAPTMLAMVLDAPGLSRADTHSLRSVGYGASSIPSAVLSRAIHEFGCAFSQGYGMTETAGNACFLSARHHARGIAGEPDILRAAGMPNPFVGTRIVDERGCDVPAGEEGEIVFRGDQVTAGYLDDHEANANAYVDGWFRTGDIGRRDPEGLLYIVDRKKDIIITGGENVSSRDVEDVLHEHPAVREAAVVGLPDAKWGEMITAFVSRRPNMSLDSRSLVAFAREQLAGYKLPKRIVFVEDLPKNASGKVLKSELRTRLGSA